MHFEAPSSQFIRVLLVMDANFTQNCNSILDKIRLKSMTEISAPPLLSPDMNRNGTSLVP